MKGILKTKTFKALVTTVIILLCAIIITANTGGSIVGNIFGFITSPMLQVTASAAENAAEIIDLDGLTKAELKRMYEAVLEENASLRAQLLDYYSLEQENILLKEQLQLKEQMPELELVGAFVVARDPNEMFFSFSIDKGYLAGVKKDDAVITSTGLVGKISHVYATSSKVTCILSEKLQVAAVSAESDESGVVTGDIQTAQAGVLKMMYLPSDTTLTQGDIIITSGASGIFPKGIIIGEVESVEQSTVDVSKYAMIKPFSDIRSVSDVFVVTGFPGSDEVYDADAEDDGQEG